MSETGPDALHKLWLRGGFPASFSASSHVANIRWRKDFVRSSLERDLPQLGIAIPARTLERFWSMLAHYHAQSWNASELARAFGVSHHAVGRYLDALESTFMVRSLRPWSANIVNLQVRAPKVYIRDSGLLHHLLDIETQHALGLHPKIGASWEGFVIENVIRVLGAKDRQCYFWGAHSEGEIDLVIRAGGRLRGFEVKHTSAPKATRSMRQAQELLQLDTLDVIHAGDRTFPLTEDTRAVAAGRMLEDLSSE